MISDFVAAETLSTRSLCSVNAVLTVLGDGLRCRCAVWSGLVIWGCLDDCASISEPASTAIAVYCSESAAGGSAQNTIHSPESKLCITAVWNWDVTSSSKSAGACSAGQRVILKGHCRHVSAILVGKLSRVLNAPDVPLTHLRQNR
jgi:hypothetical protein